MSLRQFDSVALDTASVFAVGNPSEVAVRQWELLAPGDALVQIFAFGGIQNRKLQPRFKSRTSHKEHN